MTKIFEQFVKRRTGEELSSRSSLHRTVYILLPLLIYFLVGDLVEVALWALVNTVVGHGSESLLSRAAVYGADLRAIIYAISAFVILALLRTMAKEEITYVIEKEGPKILAARDYLQYVVLGLSCALFLNLVAMLTRITELSGSFSEGVAAQRSVTFALGLVIYGLVSPFTEEILFRGIIYNRMRRLFPVKAAIVVTALLFGVFHGNLVQGIYGFLMGLLITLCYEKTRNFTVPLLLHITANAVVYALTYRDLTGGLKTFVLAAAAVVLGLLFVFSLYRMKKNEWK